MGRKYRRQKNSLGTRQIEKKGNKQFRDAGLCCEKNKIPGDSFIQYRDILEILGRDGGKYSTVP